MLRLLLLILLLVGLGYGLQRGWLQLDKDKIQQDLQRFSAPQPAAVIPSA